MCSRLSTISSKDGLGFQPKKLAMALKTPAWKSCFQPNHAVFKLITQLPNCSETNINFQSLLALSILWCSGDGIDRAEALFLCVNPPGENNENISASEKSWETVLMTLFEIAVNMTYGQNGIKHDAKLNRRIFKAMIYKRQADQPQFSGFIESLYS